jgi:hypothetical protein
MPLYDARKTVRYGAESTVSRSSVSILLNRAGASNGSAAMGGYDYYLGFTSGALRFTRADEP